MIQGDTISKQLPYAGKKEILVKDHETADIVNWIQKEHPRNAREYDSISELHWQDDARSTAQGLFKFLKDNVTYRVEHPDDQTVKTPGAILHHGYGDCKHYASYIVGVCDSLHRKGYPIKAHYRFTADLPTDPRTGEKMPVHHVFAVVEESPGRAGVGAIGYPRRKDPWARDKIKQYAWDNGLRLVHGYEAVARRGIDGTEYYVDPVLSGFNTKPHYYNIEDVMPLSRISGTGTEIGKFKLKNAFKDLAHGLVVNTQNINKGIKKAEHGLAVNAQNLKKGAEQTLKKAGNLALKVGMVPARNAFLALVALNVFNLAKKLHDTLQSPQAKDLEKTWKNTLGGDPKKLAHAIANGYKHYQKKHPGVRGVGYIGCRHVNGGYVGEPVSIVSLIALASAIIAVLDKFLHISPADKKEMGDATTAGVAEIASNTNNGINIANGEAGPDAAAALNSLTTDRPNMKVSTATNQAGDPEVTVHDVDHPVLNSAGTPGGVQNLQHDTQAGIVAVNSDPQPGKEQEPESKLEKFMHNTTQYVADHPVQVGASVLAIGTLFYLSTGRRKRR